MSEYDYKYDQFDFVMIFTIVHITQDNLAELDYYYHDIINTDDELYDKT